MTVSSKVVFTKNRFFQAIFLKLCLTGILKLLTNPAIAVSKMFQNTAVPKIRFFSKEPAELVLF